MKKLFKKYEDSHPIKPMEESLKNIEFNEYQKDEKVSTYQESLIKDKKRRKVKKGLIIATSALVAILLVPVVGVLMIGLQYKDSFSYNKKQFSSNEMSRIDTNGIKSYNHLQYSKRTSPEYNKVDEEFVNYVNDFTYQVFNDGLGIKNYGFAALSLYSHLDILSTLASTNYQDLFDEVLGDNFTRSKNLETAYNNNFFFDSPRRASLMYNGLFVDKDLTLKDEIVPRLTSKHTEAYGLDLENKNHQDQMLKWVNEHSYGQDLKLQDLNLDPLSSFYLFSSMYFSSTWRFEYDELNNRILEFTSLDGTKTNQEFMNHSILSDVYDYGTYLSFYDYYNYYSIQY